MPRTATRAKRAQAKAEPAETHLLKDQQVMTLLGNYLLSSQGDRMALANSVEARYPYLDLEFVRFAARLPRSTKLRGLKDKFILRETYGGQIPEAVRKRNEFETTVTDESAIAPAASTGESSHPVKGYRAPAATGISATL